MNWRHTMFLSGFTAFLLLIVLDGRRNIVKATMRGSSEEIPDLKKKLFVQRLDALNFLKKQEKRSSRSSEESDDWNRREESGSENENTEEDHEEWDERERRHRYEYLDYD